MPKQCCFTSLSPSGKEKCCIYAAPLHAFSRFSSISPSQVCSFAPVIFLYICYTYAWHVPYFSCSSFFCLKVSAGRKAMGKFLLHSPPQSTPFHIIRNFEVPCLFLCLVSLLKKPSSEECVPLYLFFACDTPFTHYQ